MIVAKRNGDTRTADAGGLGGGGLTSPGIQQTALHADALFFGGGHEHGHGFIVKNGNAVSDTQDGPTTHDGPLDRAAGFEREENTVCAKGPVLGEMPGPQPAHLLRAGECSVHGGMNVQARQIEERHHDGRAADDVVTGGGLDAGVGDFDREIPCGDLSLRLAQSALDTGFDFQLPDPAVKLPFIALGAAGWLDESRVVHVSTENPGGFALGFAIAIGGQEVAELVALQLHVGTILEQRLNFSADMIFVKRSGWLFEKSLENVIEIVRWHGPPYCEFMQTPNAT